MRLKVYAVIHPENGVIHQTIRPSVEQALHEFDMLQPLPWGLAKTEGFRMARFEMKETDDQLRND